LSSALVPSLSYASIEAEAQAEAEASEAEAEAEDQLASKAKLYIAWREAVYNRS
jgi:hypothetical protein